jgi:hypothetical protein
VAPRVRYTSAAVTMGAPDKKSPTPRITSVKITPLK